MNNLEDFYNLDGYSLTDELLTMLIFKRDSYDFNLDGKKVSKDKFLKDPMGRQIIGELCNVLERLDIDKVAHKIDRTYFNSERDRVLKLLKKIDTPEKLIALHKHRSEKARKELCGIKYSSKKRSHKKKSRRKNSRR